MPYIAWKTIERTDLSLDTHSRQNIPGNIWGDFVRPFCVNTFTIRLMQPIWPVSATERSTINTIYAARINDTGRVKIRLWTQDDVKHFPRYWPFVRGNSPKKTPVTRSFDVFFDMRLNNHLSKQSWGWWFETPSRSLWQHCFGTVEWLAT